MSLTLLFTNGGAFGSKQDCNWGAETKTAADTLADGVVWDGDTQVEALTTDRVETKFG